jgi:hypothetical protein
MYSTCLHGIILLPDANRLLFLFLQRISSPGRPGTAPGTCEHKQKSRSPAVHRRGTILTTQLAAVLISGLMLTTPQPLTAADWFAEMKITHSSDRSISSPTGNSIATIGDLLTLLKGQPAPDSLYLGMWSWHFINDDDSYRSQHHLIGLSWQGVFFGTFLNSHSDRSWAGGWQRDIHTLQYGELSLQTGYRIGLVHGYDELSLRGSKVFPLLQVYSDISYRDIGVQLSWAGSVFLVGFLLRI